MIGKHTLADIEDLHRKSAESRAADGARGGEGIILLICSALFRPSIVKTNEASDEKKFQALQQWEQNNLQVCDSDSPCAAALPNLCVCCVHLSYLGKLRQSFEREYGRDEKVYMCVSFIVHCDVTGYQ